MDNSDDEEYVQPRKSRRHSEDFSDLKIKKTKKRYSSDREYDDKIYYKSKLCDYFKKLNKKKQIEIIDKEEEIKKYYLEEIPLRYRILYTNIPIGTKSLILQKIDEHENMDPYNSEYHKLSKWLNGISNIPFGKFVDIPVKISDNSSILSEFMIKAHQILDRTIYGQIEAKQKIMQIMAQWITNPSSNGQMIALEGPPGVGKTSFIKNGVSKALNRPFCFYALGGATDACHLEGHSYTYEGATWGRIVEMLMESKVMNPIIFFDELDKISDTAKGQEISSILTHLTDITQNNSFYDKYFSGIPFDMSKTLYFFSYNDKTLINPILKDRLTVVNFGGYTNDDKLNIAKNFIIPEQLTNCGFSKTDIIWSDTDILYIITKYVSEEKGVRTLRRIIEDICLKINLLRLMKDDTNDSIKIPYKIPSFELPLTLNREIIDKFLKNSSIINNDNIFGKHDNMIYI